MDAIDLRRLADNLRFLRLRKGVTQKELARLAGLDRGTVTSLERGAADPLEDTIQGLARALHVHPEELLGVPVQREILPDAAELKIEMIQKILALPDERAVRLYPLLLDLLTLGRSRPLAKGPKPKT